MGNGLGSISRDLEESDNVANTISEYNKKFDSILSELLEMLQDREIILAFDELDLAYDSDDENYRNRLIGMLLATYSFYNKYKSNIRIYVFLRNDIFNILEFQDKNKIKDNIVEFLDWDSVSVESPLSLKRLISNRIASNINSSTDDYKENWDTIISQRTVGRNQLIWNFLIDRTFIRPRDMIKFLNLALEQAKLRLSIDPNSEDKITPTDIHNVRDKYSNYLFEELKDEVSSKYPNFDSYMEVLRDIHKMSFQREDFFSSYENVKARLEIDEGEDEIMKRLYEFSIIGFYKPGGGGYGGSEYRFQYKSDYQPFNPQAQRFKVHAGFKEYLELIE